MASFLYSWLCNLWRRRAKLWPAWLRPKYILDLRQRSSEWKRVRAEHLSKHPACEACGRTKNLDVHHIFPVSIAPELELSENNLITLCETPCHFVFGHFFSYHCYNKDVRKMTQQFRVKMAQRKCTQFR